MTTTSTTTLQLDSVTTTEGGAEVWAHDRRLAQVRATEPFVLEPPWRPT